MTILLTETAAKHIKKSLAKQEGTIGLRLKIKLSGCSGYAYDVDYANEIKEDDLVFEHYGSKVIIDAKSLALIDGTEIDYKQDGLNWHFVFNNPKAEALCGCGESFTIK